MSANEVLIVIRRLVYVGLPAVPVDLTTVDFSGGDWADLIVRQQDPNNYYAVRIGKDTGGGTGPVDFIKTVRGKQTTVASGTYTTGASVAVKVKISGSTLTA